MRRRWDLNKLTFILVIALSNVGCAKLTESFVRWNDPSKDPKNAEKIRNEYLAEMRARVVYTPLITGKPKQDATNLEILIRPPKKEFREIGLISMYRKYSNETAADLLPFMKERAALEGANAILLYVASEVPTGVVSSGAAVPVGDTILTSGYATYMREGTLQGAAIIYEK